MLDALLAQLLGGQAVDDLPGLHDHEPIAHVGDDAEIVADQQVGKVSLLAQVAEKVQDLGLNRDVERRGRLVENSTSGSSIRARAMATRWRWPPESWCG